MPLLGVLQVGETMKDKLAEGGKLKVRKKIRALVREVADRFCGVSSRSRPEMFAMGKGEISLRFVIEGGFILV